MNIILCTMNKTLSIILLFIAGLFVGCERYDHLIQDLNDRIEVLEGATIAPITEQIKQINVSYTDLTTVDTALEALIKDLSEELLKLQQQADENSDAIAEITALIKELQDRDAALDQQIKDLKSYLDDEIKAAKYWAEATFATLEQYAEMQTEISRISALIEAYKAEQENDYTEAIDKAVTDVLAAITVSETSMKEWVNKILAEGYYDIAQIDAILFALETKLVGADAELTKEIEAQQAALELAKTDLTDAYKKAIKEAIEENNGKISKEIADAVQAALDNVDAKLAAINETITEIQSDIEAINTKIATIDEQIENINASLDELQNVDASLQTLIDALSVQAADLQSQLDANAAADAAAKKELKEQIEALNALIEGLKETEDDVQAEIASLETYVDSELKSTKDWAEATFATLDQYTALQTEIATITALLEQHKGDLTTDYTSAIATAVENMQAAITASEEAMKDWVEDYLADCYYDIAAIDGLLAALEMTLEEGDTQLAEQIAAQQAALDKAKQDLTDAYEKAIKEAIEENNGKITEDITAAVEAAEVRLEAKITAINAEVESIKALINSLKETVNNLVGRIQSMRYIPEFSDGKVALGLGERTAELTFMISPRDAAAGVAAAWASTNDVVTAFIKPTQPRTKASYDMEALAVTNVTGNANGTLVVTISTEDLSEDFWYEGIEANVFVCISDGNNDIISEMIPIYYVAVPYVTFKASAAQTLKIDMDVNGMQFSTDKGATWHSLTASTDNATFGPDNDLLLRGINSGGTDNTTISFTDGSVPVACSGDIRTLVDYRNYANVDTGSAMFTFLFWQCTVLTSAPELPATTLARYCYSNMFDGCTGLTKAPSLPATQLAEYCYSNMFSGCTGLTSAPELPATTLAKECYYSMFNGCTGLTSAPELPATTLATECYYSMFNGCTGLTSAPELPATTLATKCYSSMFNGCIGLTTAPELPATRLSETCYSYMFYGCTGLTSAPVLPAATLTTGCYQAMFNGCSSLNEITMLATNVSASRCLNEWVSGVAATGTFTKVAEVTLTTGASGIPAGWTVIQEASKGVDAPDFGFGGSFSN